MVTPSHFILDAFCITASGHPLRAIYIRDPGYVLL